MVGIYRLRGSDRAPHNLRSGRVGCARVDNIQRRRTTASTLMTCHAPGVILLVAAACVLAEVCIPAFPAARWAPRGSCYMSASATSHATNAWRHAPRYCAYGCVASCRGAGLGGGGWLDRRVAEVLLSVIEKDYTRYDSAQYCLHRAEGLARAQPHPTPHSPPTPSLPTQHLITAATCKLIISPRAMRAPYFGLASPPPALKLACDAACRGCQAA